MLKVTRHWYDLFGAAEQNYDIYMDGSVRVTTKALSSESTLDLTLSDEELASVEEFLDQMPDISSPGDSAASTDSDAETWDYISYDEHGNESVSLTGRTFDQDTAELEEIRTVLMTAYNTEYQRQFESLTLTVSTELWSTQDSFSCEVYRNGKVFWTKTSIEEQQYKLTYEIPVNERDNLKKLIEKPMSSYKESIRAKGITDGTYYDITNYDIDGNEIGTFSGMIMYNDDLEEILDIISPEGGIFQTDEWTEVSGSSTGNAGDLQIDTDMTMLAIECFDPTEGYTYSGNISRGGHVYWEKASDHSDEKYIYRNTLSDVWLDELTALADEKPMSEYTESEEAEGMMDGMSYTITNYDEDLNKRGTFSGYIIGNDTLEEIIEITFPGIYSDEWEEVSD